MPTFRIEFNELHRYHGWVAAESESAARQCFIDDVWDTDPEFIEIMESRIVTIEEEDE